MKFESSSGKKVRDYQIRDIVESFEKTGSSNHSVDGLMLAPLLNHLTSTDQGFVLRYYPGGGYYLEKWNPEQETTYRRSDGNCVKAGSEAQSRKG